MGPLILVVEDDAAIAENLAAVLHDAGYEVRVAADGFAALCQLSATPPDLMLLDLNLPDMPGEQVLRSVRETSSVPVIVLTAYDGPHGRFSLAGEGASDYLTKPYRDEELLACVQRQLAARGPEAFVTGPLEFDLVARRAFYDGKDLLLVGGEFDLLLALAQQPSRILSEDELAWRLHLGASEGSRHLIRVQLAGVRAALRAAGEENVLRAVRDLGFTLLPRRAKTSAARP